MSLRRFDAEEFARRLKVTVAESDKRYAFFLGAGCSVSSGIPAAGSLVRDYWLPRLRDLRAPNRRDLDAWAHTEFESYESGNPAMTYGSVLQELFPYPEDRQREIERLCEGKYPSFGYAVLAGLVGLEGGCFNVVLTTNFDDMVADALYLYTKSRPLVIAHESLASFIRPTRTRPVVVKLHGDHRLTPQNTAEETRALKARMRQPVRTMLHDRGLIFIGYGGNDHGIRGLLEALPPEALPLGVYWISGGEPLGTIRPWLEARRAVWIESSDFDQLMLIVRDIFDLPHPGSKRFDDVFERYALTYQQLSERITVLSDSKLGSSSLEEAVKRTDESFPNWWSVELRASRLKSSDPAQADAIYANGLAHFPLSVELFNNYANFLRFVRKDYERAEALYRRAIEADPGNAPILGNYASFLSDVRKDYERAEALYRRAIEADPGNATNLGNYANFLSNVRKDHEQAEALYRRAIEADPGNATNLGNYAGFTLSQGRNGEGMAALRQALESADPVTQQALIVECWFYYYANGPVEERPRALSQLKTAVEAGARSPGWILDANVSRSREDGHPAGHWLVKLAEVITGESGAAALNGWDDWSSA